MSYKNYRWKVIAHDFNSPFFRNYIWVNSLFLYPKLGFPKLRVGIECEGNKINYIADMETWKECHEGVKSKVLEDIDYFEKLIDETNKKGESFNKWSEEHILNADLRGLSSKDIVNLMKIFFEKQSEIYAYGIILPVLDFQNFSFIERNLTKFLKSKNLAESEYKKVYSIFTEPTYNSFSRDQEEDLLRLMENFYEHDWCKDVKNKSLEKIKEIYPTFYKELQNHTKKYKWVYYVYSGPAFTEEGFFDFIKLYLDDFVNPTNKLNENVEKREKNAKLKRKYIDELKPNEFELGILHLSGKMVWAKPRRKDYQSKSYYHIEKLHKEIAKRLLISLDQARSINLDNLEEYLEKKEVNLELLNSIIKYHICLPNDDGTVSIFKGSEAKEVSGLFERVTENIADVKELHGSCACEGKVKGRVRIINCPQEMDKMENGDVLVSIATTPSIVPAMKKAAAIITDEGGLTCHAAIVSRELGIPCVIGTKIATKVFKDGDLVEVDAEKGIIKKKPKGL